MEKMQLKKEEEEAAALAEQSAENGETSEPSDDKNITLQK